MNLKIKISALSFLLIIPNSCGPNLFDQFSQTKDTYDAIIEDTKIAIDNSDYDLALSHLSRLDSSKRETLDVKLLYTSVYSGKCGISFTRIIDAISESSNSPSPMNLTVLALTTAQGLTTTDEPSCELAKAEVESFTPSQISSNSRIPFAGFLVGFVRLGLTASEFDGNDDGVIEDPALVCDKTSFTDAKVKKLVTSLNMVLVNLAGLGTNTIPNVDTSLMSQIDAACPGSGSCFSSDEADLTFDSDAAMAPDAELTKKATAYLMRSIFATSEFGTSKTNCNFAAFSGATDSATLLAAMSNCCVP